MAGTTFRQIAETAGYNSPQAAYAAVDRALQDTLQEPADRLRKIEVERLDRMMRKPYLAACGGDGKALHNVLRIMERKAKLLGLDAPQKIETSEGTTYAEFVEETRLRGGFSEVSDDPENDDE